MSDDERRQAAVAAAWHEFRYPRPALDEPPEAFMRAIRVALTEASAATAPAVDRSAAVQLLAERALHRYESEHSANHLTWHDFADEVGADLDALIAAGYVRTGPVGEEGGRQ
jgi:hypothetical protein